MENIIGGKSGEFAYNVAIDGTDLVIGADYEAAGYVGAKLEVRPHIKLVLEAIKKAIPGTIDDAIINKVEEYLDAQNAPKA